MSRLGGFVHRVRVRLRPGASLREREEEARFHEEMETVELRAKASGARGAARLDPADLTPVRDKLPWIRALADHLHQDLGYAIRGLVRTPGFTVMVLLTLGLGVGANAAVFSVLDRVFWEAPPGVRNPDGVKRLYLHDSSRTTERGNPFVFPDFNYPEFSAVRDAAGSTGRMAAWVSSSEDTLRDGERELPVRTEYVSPDYFRVLGVHAAPGRLFAADERRIDVPARVVVISHGLWKRDFGLDPSVLGRTVEMDSAVYTIVGVTAGDFAGLDLSRTDVFLPLNDLPVPNQNGVPWYRSFGNFLQAVARLPAGADGRALATRATVAFRRMQPIKGFGADRASTTVLLGPILEAQGPEEQQPAIEISTRAAGVSLIVLLIACANVAGLLLVRASSRRREIAVRLALGISRARLTGQLLTESVLLGALSTVVALFVGGWGGGVLRRLVLPGVAWVRPGLDGPTVAFVLVAAVVVGLAAGLVPALHARRVGVGASLGSGPHHDASSRSALRSTLLVVQGALSVVLLVGAVLFVRSLRDVTNVRVGYDIDRLAYVMLLPGQGHPDPRLIEGAQETAARLRSAPGVSGVALASMPPMWGFRGTAIAVPGRDSIPGLPGGRGVVSNRVSPGFFQVTGTRILSGRAFEAGDTGVAVVTENMARVLWPGRDALGQCLIVGPKGTACTTVVGVSENVHQMGIIEDPQPQLFLPMEGCPGVSCTIVLRIDPNRWSSVTAPVVRDEVSRRLGHADVRVARLSDLLERQYRPWQLGAELFTAFGILALLVTMVGIYSVTAYAVAQRTHEMGVRIALGATLHDLLTLVVRERLRAVALGGAVGVALALAFGRLVASLLYGVTPRDPISIAAAVLVVIATGVIASLVPAWRAGHVDPVKALSTE